MHVAVFLHLPPTNRRSSGHDNAEVFGLRVVDVGPPVAVFDDGVTATVDGVVVAAAAVVLRATGQSAS